MCMRHASSTRLEERWATTKAPRPPHSHAAPLTCRPHQSAWQPRMAPYKAEMVLPLPGHSTSLAPPESPADSAPDCHVKVHLPARIIIQLPDGEVSLGEDSTRLRAIDDDIAAAKRRAAADEAAAAEEGSLGRAASDPELVAQQYSFRLRSLASQRGRLLTWALGASPQTLSLQLPVPVQQRTAVPDCKRRHAAVLSLHPNARPMHSTALCIVCFDGTPLRATIVETAAPCRVFAAAHQRSSLRRVRAGVDIGAMLWPLICVLFMGSFGKLGIEVSTAAPVVYALSGVALASDAAMLVCLCGALQRCRVLHALTWLQVLHLFVMVALRFDLNLWLVTRPLVIGLAFSVRAVHLLYMSRTRPSAARDWPCVLHARCPCPLHILLSTVRAPKQ